MPIISKRFRVWEAIYDRFLLEPTQGSITTPQVSETVVPIIDADALLRVRSISNSNQDLSGASFVTYATVPAGEEWALVAGHRAATIGSTQVSILIGGVQLRVTALGTGEEPFTLRNIILRQGDVVGMGGTSDGADTAIQMGFHFGVTDLT